GIYKGRQDVNGYDPLGAGDLTVQTTYFWRIDEVNESDPNLWKGNTWTFKTIEYTDVIDDMESYATAGSRYLIRGKTGSGARNLYLRLLRMLTFTAANNQ
ncbi:hypothetical protein LCGC14_2650770, partial [marine sediment metagenome]